MHLAYNWRHRRRGDSIDALQTLFIFISTFSFILHQCSTEPTKIYQINDICERSPNFLSTYRTIDGALITSRNEKNVDCTITFQTNSILQRFMLRFDSLNLDCNDKLYVYDGAHIGNIAHREISCKDTKEKIGTLFTRTNHVTLRYTTDSWGNDNGFKLVITAIKDGKHSCKDFRCSSKDFCINPDLLCDRINHCEDGSDEELGKVCTVPIDETVLGLKFEWMTVTITIFLLLIFVIGGFSVGICFCRRKFVENISDEKSLASNHLNHQYDLDNSKHLNSYRPAVSVMIKLMENIPPLVTGARLESQFN